MHILLGLIGLKVGELHGNLSQTQRLESLRYSAHLFYFMCFIALMYYRFKFCIFLYTLRSLYPGITQHLNILVKTFFVCFAGGLKMNRLISWWPQM